MPPKDVATQPGATEGKQPTAPILRPSRREMLESIGKRRVETFNKEQKEAGSEEFIEVSGELTGDDDEDVDNEDRAAERERAKLEQEAADAKALAAKEAKPAKSEIDKQLEADDRVTVIDDPSKYRVRVKVDGEEKEMVLADVVRIQQKESAADRRLEQASTMLKAAEAAVADATETGKAKAERDIKAAQEAKDAAATDFKAQLKDYNDLLYAGKTEEAAEAMVKIMDARDGRSTAATREAPQVVDMKKLKDEVKSELRTESALETFAGAYPEIIANPDLAKIADRHYEAARKEGKSDAEAFKAAGDATRGYVKELAKSLGMAEVKPKTAGRESLEARKAEIDEPETASLGTSLKDATPAESNPRSTIAEMAASRPGAMAHAAAAKRQAGG